MSTLSAAFRHLGAYALDAIHEHPTPVDGVVTLNRLLAPVKPIDSRYFADLEAAKGALGHAWAARWWAAHDNPETAAYHRRMARREVNRLRAAAEYIAAWNFPTGCSASLRPVVPWQEWTEMVRAAASA